MTIEDMKNSLVFMERATVTGKEAFGWVQTYVALQNELTAALKAADQPAKS